MNSELDPYLEGYIADIKQNLKIIENRNIYLKKYPAKRANRPQLILDVMGSFLASSTQTLRVTVLDIFSEIRHFDIDLIELDKIL